MARFQELDSAQGKGKVVMDDGRPVMVQRKSTMFLGTTYWSGGGCSAPSGNGLAKAMQRAADKKGKGKGKGGKRKESWGSWGR